MRSPAQATAPGVLLDRMLADMADQPALLRPTEFWREASAQIVAELKSEGFENFRRLPFRRNVLNVFDKLNAPQTDFITRERVQGWFAGSQFEDVTITPYKGVSWRASGTVRHG